MKGVIIKMSCCCSSFCCSYSCEKEPSTFVMDRICTGWSVPEANSQDVYVSPNVKIFASGFLAYDEGDSDFVIFKFFNNNIQIGNSLTVYEGSSVGFTSNNFTRIEVTIPTGNPGNISSGQICITPRYEIDSN